jgi:hypothetical protein
VKLGDWYTYCDICGQKCLASSVTKLTTYTGHGGAIVCKHDVDAIDYGLIPFRPRTEKNVPWVRPGDTNTDNAMPLVDYESMTYQYYLADSQDGYIILSSQDDAIIISETPV